MARVTRRPFLSCTAASGVLDNLPNAADAAVRARVRPIESLLEPWGFHDLECRTARVGAAWAYWRA